MDDSNLNDCPPIVKRYLTTSHPDLPEDLQFLPPEKHRKVFEGFHKIGTIDADRLKDHEDLLVDLLVYMVAPCYVRCLCLLVSYPRQGCLTIALGLIELIRRMERSSLR